MKQIFIITLCSFILTIGFSQDRQGEMAERMEAQKVAFITNKLNLNTAEAQTFWPVYNELNEARQALRAKYDIRRPDLMVMSDSEATDYYKKMIDVEYEKLDIMKKYSAQMLDIIGPRKTLVLFHLEDQFKKEILENFKKRMRENRSGRPGK